MKEKMLRWSGRSFLALLLLLVSLLFSDGVHAQTLTPPNPNSGVRGIWYEPAQATTLLVQEINLLEVSMQAPQGVKPFNVLKHKHALYEMVLSAILAGEPVDVAFYANHEKLSGSVQPDTPTAALNNQDMNNLRAAGIALLTY